MSSTRSVINPRVIFLPLISFIQRKFKNNQYKTHDYTFSAEGHDYVFEPVDNLTKGYMTAQGQGIKPGDYILLRRDSSTYKYQVEAIDYYSEPPDMWIALLKLVVRDSESSSS